MSLSPTPAATLHLTPPEKSFFFVWRPVKVFFQVTWSRMQGENPSWNRDGPRPTQMRRDKVWCGEGYIRMDPGLQQAFNPLAPSQDTAMHVPAGSVTSHLGTSSRGYFYFTTASLALCLVFAVVTIMVLVVQKTVSGLLFFAFPFWFMFRFLHRDLGISLKKKKPASCREREQRNGNLTLPSNMAFWEKTLSSPLLQLSRLTWAKRRERSYQPRAIKIFKGCWSRDWYQGRKQ